jgi:hypothetical protein
MASTYLSIIFCAIFPLIPHASPFSESPAVGPDRQVDHEFINGKVICTGHMLEDNFEDNLAPAAASKYYKF